MNIHKYPMVDFFTCPIVGQFDWGSPSIFGAIPPEIQESFPGQEDSDDSGEAAFLGPPNAEPLQHIVHREAEATGDAVRLLGLETVSFQKSIWDAAVIVMLHAGGGARKVVGNFNVALTKIGEFGCVFVWEGLIGSLRKVSIARQWISSGDFSLREREFWLRRTMWTSSAGKPMVLWKGNSHDS